MVPRDENRYEDVVWIQCRALIQYLPTTLFFYHHFLGRDMWSKCTQHMRATKKTILLSIILVV